MIECGAIRQSNNPFSSNVVIVRKKDRTIRFCIDFRKLNNRTIKDAYAIPRIENTLHLLAGSKYFSKLDLKAGYWQVSVKEEDRYKTAFQVGPLGFYECNRMPFGLTNAPATFQRLMERCMGDLNLRDCLIYLDDIIIFSPTFEEHLQRLEAVFAKLAEHSLKLKPSKCEFFKSKVTYLGHVVSEEGIQADPEKIAAVKSWPVPKSIKEVRQFLGFTGYYRRFIKGYASVVKPLNNLLIGHSTKKGHKSSQKKTPFVWEIEQQQAFDDIIKKLTHPPILAYANYQLPFIVHTDASSTGLGAILYQRQGGVNKVIAYASRSLKPSEKHYPAHKLEFLALKWAVTAKFNDYLYGNSFEVLTDNNPLTYVQTTAKLDATGHRWMAALSNYNFEIKYRSGKQNSDADGLSRKYETDSQEFSRSITSDVINALSISATTDNVQAPIAYSLVAPDSLSSVEPSKRPLPDNIIDSLSLCSKDWRKAQHDDATISQIVTYLKEGTKPYALQACTQDVTLRKYLREWDQLELRDGVVYRRGKLGDQEYVQLVLPVHLREEMFLALHDDLGHQGRDRTTSLFKQRFYWPGMDTWIENRVQRCERCIKRKKYPVTAPLVNFKASAPMEILCIDFLSLERSKGGLEHILVCTDVFTRYAQAYPTRNQTAKTTARVLFEQFISHYGFPSRIHSDQGANFESSLIKELCELAGVAKSHTTPYHPMGNPVERFNSTLLKMLGTLDNNLKADWKSHVAPLVHAYNVTLHPSTGYSPYFLMFGRHPKLAIDALLSLPNEDSAPKGQHEYVKKLKEKLSFAYRKAQETSKATAAKNKKRYDISAKASRLMPGNIVLARNVTLRGKHKLADRWEDVPYIVVSQPNEDIPVYEIIKDCRNAKKTRVLHRNHLLPLGFTDKTYGTDRTSRNQSIDKEFSENISDSNNTYLSEPSDYSEKDC
jgi:transposase InsO family protein